MQQRIPFIDTWRGAALVGMIGYHFWFDLALLGIIDPLPWWHIFLAQMVLVQFLYISGVVNQLKFYRGGSFATSAKTLIFASFSITAATWLFAAENTVYFGVLHLLSLAVVLTPHLMKLSVTQLKCLTLAIVFLALLLPDRSAFLQPWLLQIGIAPINFSSFDYTPVLPWLAFYCLGLTSRSDRFPTYSHTALTWLGKRSLPVYLVHQPLILGVLYAIMFILYS